ncbi:MAG: CPBP family intramembrane glutamic endopeptidase [Cyanobacteriota bacterium]
MAPGQPRWRGTLAYPALLVALFLGGQGLLALVGVPESQRAAPAAVPALLALVCSLPWRLRRAWGETQPWRRLGLCGRGSIGLTRALLRGLLKALLLLLLLLAGLQLSGQIQWQPQLTTALILNGLALGLGVGFAEELLFRGWLLGELELELGSRRGLVVQALIFSLVHTRFNLPLPGLFGLLVGLMALGLVLALQRRADGGLLWGAVGLHGGLVGGWFVLTQGLIQVSPQTPLWLSGPANPIGGLLGWLGLGLLLLARRRWWPQA